MIWSDIPFASIEEAGSNLLLFNLMMHYYPTGRSKSLDNYLLDIGSDMYNEADAQKVWMLQVRPASVHIEHLSHQSHFHGLKQATSLHALFLGTHEDG